LFFGFGLAEESSLPFFTAFGVWSSHTTYLLTKANKKNHPQAVTVGDKIIIPLEDF